MKQLWNWLLSVYKVYYSFMVFSVLMYCFHLNQWCQLCTRNGVLLWGCIYIPMAQSSGLFLSGQCSLLVVRPAGCLQEGGL